MCRMAFNLREEAALEEKLTNIPEGTLRWEVYQPPNVSRQEETTHQGEDSLDM